MKNLLLLSSIIFFIVTTLRAQPVLTNSNHTPLPNQTFLSFNCDTTVSEGNGGANQVWDFNTLTVTTDNSSIYYFIPSETPYASSFPTANLAALISTSNFSIYDYYHADSSAFTEVGAASVFSLIVNAKPYVLITYPFSYDSLLMDTVNETYAGGNTISGITELKCDGYGTLHLRGTTYEDVLRIKHMDSTVYYYTGLGFQTRFDTSYSWYDTTHRYALLTIRYIRAEQPGLGSQFLKSVIIVEDVTGSVHSPGDKALPVSIYPNPSGGAGNISYFLHGSSDVLMEIYDVVGRKIISQKENHLLPGNHSFPFSGLRDGIYVVKIKAGDESNSSRFVVIKK